MCALIIIGGIKHCIQKYVLATTGILSESTIGGLVQQLNFVAWYLIRWSQDAVIRISEIKT